MEERWHDFVKEDDTQSLTCRAAVDTRTSTAAFGPPTTVKHAVKRF